MKQNYIKRRIIGLFRKCFFEKVKYIKIIKGGISDRIVYKLKSEHFECIGVHNFKLKENEAFIEFTISLQECGINVPTLYLISDDREFYLEEYVGDKSLFDFINNKNTSKTEKLKLHKKALSDLAKIQIYGDKKIEYKYCYETNTFNRKQILFDFNKFYNLYLLKMTDINLSDVQVSKIKNAILRELQKEKKLFFMYRDFQPRNIMLKDDTLYYIDYQSGRKGPLQYDVASYLYSGSIELDEKERQSLLIHYIKEITMHIKINRNEFISSFYYFAYIRLLQVLGSYGFVYEKSKDKKIFRKIDKALFNLKTIKNKIENKNLRFLIEELISHPAKP